MEPVEVSDLMVAEEGNRVPAAVAARRQVTGLPGVDDAEGFSA